MSCDKVLLEYVWLDGYSTTNLRSKIKVVSANSLNPDLTTPTVDMLPTWNFDGSSTRQAPGGDSECILQPVRIYEYDITKNHYFVLCEVENTDGTPHETNTRANLRNLSAKANGEEFWWGFEQEYFLTFKNRPVGFPAIGYPPPQGEYYCGVGANQVQNRDLVMRHMFDCLDAGIEITGVNAEVAIGQWEYQCFAKDTLKACDDLWISRYFLQRLGEEYGLDIDFSPKPIAGDWNGSGCHANFSTEWMRDGYRGSEGIEELMACFADTHAHHISQYGEENHKRLTGNHETQHIDEFSYGIADRGASIRIPTDMVKNNWGGYLEDRRPASNCDPYKVARAIVESTIG